MRIKEIIAAAALICVSATASSGATINAGDATNGATVSSTLAGARQGDFIEFSLGNVAPGFGITRLEIDTLGSAFNTEIGLFDANDNLVASNNDGGGAFGQASRLVFTRGDGNVPAAGNYTLVLGAWNINFGPTINDTSFNGFPSGAYNLNITSTISAVPVPAAGLLLLTALGAGIAMRRRSTPTA